MGGEIPPLTFEVAMIIIQLSLALLAFILFFILRILVQIAKNQRIMNIDDAGRHSARVSWLKSIDGLLDSIDNNLK